jgi:hypothetical protein
LISRVKALSPIPIHEQLVTLKEFSELLYQEQALAIEIRNNHIAFGSLSGIVKVFIECLTKRISGGVRAKKMESH